jgi:hypothetical protein
VEHRHIEETTTGIGARSQKHLRHRTHEQQWQQHRQRRPTLHRFAIEATLKVTTGTPYTENGAVTPPTAGESYDHFAVVGALSNQWPGIWMSERTTTASDVDAFEQRCLTRAVRANDQVDCSARHQFSMGNDPNVLNRQLANAGHVRLPKQPIDR